MDSLTFYFDRTFGKRLPRALNSLKPPGDIRWHQGERFPQNMPDDEWMNVVGPKRWVVISQDRKFHLFEAEKKAIIQHAIKCFYFPCASEDRWISLCGFTKHHLKVIQIAKSMSGPFIYELKGNGRFYKVRLS
jgi:hypothetical protein